MQDAETLKTRLRDVRSDHATLVSEVTDGRYLLVVFPTPDEFPTLQGSILLPEETSTMQTRDKRRVTEYDLSSTNHPVDRIDVGVSYKPNPTAENIGSMVPGSIRNLCLPRSWRQADIEIYQKEVPPTDSEAPDSVLSQAR